MEMRLGPEVQLFTHDPHRHLITLAWQFAISETTGLVQRSGLVIAPTEGEGYKAWRALAVTDRRDGTYEETLRDGYAIKVSRVSPDCAEILAQLLVVVTGPSGSTLLVEAIQRQRLGGPIGEFRFAKGLPHELLVKIHWECVPEYSGGDRASGYCVEWTGEI